MTNLLDDLDDIAKIWDNPMPTSDFDKKCKRIRAFIKAHQPWYPPQPEGFGPWIEYKEGDKGPCVNDVVQFLRRDERKHRRFKDQPKISSDGDWSIEDVDGDIVAYCVKETP